MTSTSKPSPRRPKVSLAGVAVLPLLRGRDGAVTNPAAQPAKRSDGTVSVSLCSRSNRLRIGFQACGIAYVGKAGTEDPVEAALIGAALRDAVEARLVATGFDEVRLTLLHLKAHRAATPTRRSDAQLMLSIACSLARSAPRAVAEGTTTGRKRPAWSVRPVDLAVQRALR